MKVFLIGFIGAFIGWSVFLGLSLGQIIKTFQDLAVITISLVICGFVAWQISKSSCGWVKHKFRGGKIKSSCGWVKHKFRGGKIKSFCGWIKHQFKRLVDWVKYVFGIDKNKKNNENASDWQCLLITGDWGSGKTHYYKTNYKDKGSAPDIYISCFSASRAELVAQIIQQQLWCRLFTLNGLLAKLMESNWQLFMPTKRTVVFDDVERLHTDKIAYQDLIGIVDYLKNKGKCRIILICNQNQIAKESDSGVFNLYMERVVDDIIKPPKVRIEGLIKDLVPRSKVLDKVIEICQKSYDEHQIHNLRVFKTAVKQFAEQFKKSKSNSWDEKQQIIYAETFAERIRINILLRYLFFADHNLFRKASQYIEPEIKKKVQYISPFPMLDKNQEKYSKIDQELEDEEYKVALNTVRKTRGNINGNLNKYGKLTLSNFSNGKHRNNTRALLALELNEEEFERYIPMQVISRPFALFRFGNDDSAARKLSEFLVKMNDFGKELSDSGVGDSEETHKMVLSLIEEHNTEIKKISSELKNWRKYITNKQGFFYKLVETNADEWIAFYFKDINIHDLRWKLTMYFVIYLTLAELGFNQASQKFLESILGIGIQIEEFNKFNNTDKHSVIYATFRLNLFWFLADGQYDVSMTNLSNHYDEMLTKFQQTQANSANLRFSS